MHGAKRSCLRTPQGFANPAEARTTHGNHTAVARANHRYEAAVIVRTRTLLAATLLHEHLPADIRNRYDLGSDELAPPWHPQPRPGHAEREKIPKRNPPPGTDPATARRQPKIRARPVRAAAPNQPD